LHERWIKDDVKPGTARRNIARRLSAVMWGMWKSGDVYRPELVGIAERSPAQVSWEQRNKDLRRRRSLLGGN